MYFFDRPFRTVVAVRMAGQDLFPVFVQKDIVDTPGVDRHALDLPELTERLLQSRHDLAEQTFRVPNQRAVYVVHAVIKPIHFLRAKLSAFFPADDVPSAGRSDIDCYVIFHFFLRRYHYSEF